jgi:lysophospholipase L1-like esterase
VRVENSWRRSALVAGALATISLVGSVIAIPAPAHADAAQRVFLVGDSVMVGATPDIRAGAGAHGWSVTVDAKVGRTTLQGAAILAAVRAQLPSVVVVELGNNDGGNAAFYHHAIDVVMTELSGVRYVVWYTITPFAAWVPAANAELEAAARRWPNLRVAEWASVGEQTPGALYGAGPHLRAPGAQAFADLLYSTLDHLGSAVTVIGSFSASKPAFAAAAPDGDGAAIAFGAARGTLWTSTRDGRVYTRNGTPAPGSLASPPSEPIVGMSATPSGHGYWLVASDGGIFSFGDARFYGSTGAFRLSRPIVGMSSTPTGHGYWLVASDGGIFSFGDARFYGSTGAFRLNRPIVGMSSTPTGHGYWLVASDGGIFSFGDARFHGSTGALRLNRPIVGMSSTPTGHGYWLVATDGGVFTFGDAQFDGSGAAFHAITGASFIGVAPDASGYELVGVMTGGRQ